MIAALRALFRAYEADEADAARFRARQIHGLLRLTPLAMAINIFNAVMVAVVVQDQAPALVLRIWVLLVLAQSTLGLRAWWRARRGAQRGTASRRAMRHAAWHAGVLGLTWAVVPAWLFPQLDMQGQFVIGMVSTGMLCAGGFALYSVPWAATAYVVAMGLGCGLALVRWPAPVAASLTLLLAAYTATVLFSVWSAARNFGTRLMAEARADRQSEVIGLLLRDFEDHTSDLLWELDQLGCFVNVSQRLGGLLRQTPERLVRLSASKLLRRAVPRDIQARAHWDGLLRQLAGTNAFRDLVIMLDMDNGPRWWSLSARPLTGSDGRLTGWRGVAADITERQQAHERLRWLAHHDALTGLVNRPRFHELLRHALRPEALAHEPVAVLTLDLDDFKQINDTQGHAAGDQMLRTLATRLGSVARRNDTVARLGGDEFAMLVTGAGGAPGLEPLLERLRQVLHTPGAHPGSAMVLRASMGIAFAPVDGADVDTLLNHADMALYAAKRAGGDNAVFFQRPLAAESRRRNSLEQALRGALARGEFHLVYQPQISARDGHIEGFEALLRWEHPELGALPPGEFIAIAETAGLMPAIGTWVLYEACRQLHAWSIPLRMSINISAKQLADAGLVDTVRTAAQGLDSAQIELEITESALIDDPQTALDVLGALRAQGFRVALDDFGTGYSALAYLRRFRFDTLKIDQSFIRNLRTEAETQAIVDAILAMAKGLKMDTVAEGVEHPLDARLLREKGCTALQGYLISRPLAPAAVLDFVRGWRGLELDAMGHAAGG